MEEPLVERLAAAEQRHLEVVADLLAPAAARPSGRRGGSPGDGCWRPGRSRCPPSCSTTVPSIASRVRSRSSRIPFWVMSCQIVSAERDRDHPGHRQRDPGLLARAPRSGRSAPVRRAGTKSRKLIRRNRTNPSTLRVIRPYRAPTWSWASDREVHLHQVGDQADAHVLVDARAGVLDQVAAEHVHGLADQVSQADQAQVDSRAPDERHPGRGPGPWPSSPIRRASPARWRRPYCRAGQAHDQECASTGPSDAARAPAARPACHSCRSGGARARCL